MKRISSFLLIGIFFLGLCDLAWSATPKVSVEIDKDEVILGDAVRLTITLQGISSASPPKLPPIPDFDVRFLGSSRESFTSFTVIIQGKKMEKRKSGGGMRFEYALTPKKIGTFTIPQFSFRVEGQDYRTAKPFLIKVSDLPETQGDILVKVSLDKETVYLGESVLLTFEWFFDKNIQDYSLNIPWFGALKDFLVEEPESDPNRKHARLIINDKERLSAEKKTVMFRGKRYTVLTFQEILTPISAGVYTLDPTFLRAEVVKGYEQPRRSRSRFFGDYFDWSFDEFFGRRRRAVTESIVTRSQPVTLFVEPLPKDRPPTFTGAVGDFDFQVTVSPKTVQRGEPVTVTLKVVGSGNFNEIQLPDFPELFAFKGYAPEIRTDTSIAEGLVIGEKAFEKVLVGRREGTYEIPPLPFSFFNPESGRYETITRGPFSIQVVPGTTQETLDQTGTLESEPKRRGKEIKVITQDIRYIKADLGLIHREAVPLYERRLFLFFGFVPLPLVTAVSFLIQRRRLRFRKDIGYARRIQAFKKAHRELTHCTQFFKEGKAEEFYSGISKVLTRFLGDKLNRPPAGITGEIVEALQERNVDPALLQELKSCFESIDLAKYSLASGDPQQMKKIWEHLRQLLSRLEKVV